MNNYDNYCTKLFGKHTCTEKDCPTCPVAKIISEHDKNIRIDENDKCIEVVEKIIDDCIENGGCRNKCDEPYACAFGIDVKVNIEQLKEYKKND